MRIISGDARGRRLIAPRGLKTRPATARVRASIFSRIASRLELNGAYVLDLFAGSGSLGLEALSRGAAAAVFVDSSRDAAAVITQNIEQFGFSDRAGIVIAEVFRALNTLAGANRFDLVFIDPPFAQDSSAKILAKLASTELLKPHAMIIVRQFYRAPELEAPGYERVNLATLGDHRIALYRRLTAVSIGAPGYAQQKPRT